MNSIEGGKPARRTDLDWIRVLAVLLLVPFHGALIFVLSPYAVMYVKDTVGSSFLDIFSGWIHQFHMPILFYVAGASTFFALKKRTAAQYVKERFLKLLLPALAGIVLLIPPMTYITAIWNGAHISYGEHFLNFWHFNPADLNGLSGCFTPAHTWFLIYLFLYSLVCLPLFKGISHNRALDCLSRIIDKVGTITVMVVLFVLTTLAAKTNLLGSINPIYYILLFFTGFLFMADARFQKTIDKGAIVFLVAGVVFETVRHLYLYDIQQITQSEWIVLIIEQLNRWWWLLAALGFGHKYLNKNNKVLAYLSGASFPFYIFHLLVTTIVGYFVIRLHACIGIKYLIIIVASTALTLFVYQIVKRIPFVRFLFGIKKKSTCK